MCMYDIEYSFRLTHNNPFYIRVRQQQFLFLLFTSTHTYIYNSARLIFNYIIHKQPCTDYCNFLLRDYTCYSKNRLFSRTMNKIVLVTKSSDNQIDRRKQIQLVSFCNKQIEQSTNVIISHPHNCIKNPEEQIRFYGNKYL